MKTSLFLGLGLSTVLTGGRALMPRVHRKSRATVIL